MNFNLDNEIKIEDWKPELPILEEVINCDNETITLNHQDIIPNLPIIKQEIPETNSEVIIPNFSLIKEEMPKNNSEVIKPNLSLIKQDIPENNSDMIIPNFSIIKQEIPETNLSPIKHYGNVVVKIENNLNKIPLQNEEYNKLTFGSEKKKCKYCQKTFESVNGLEYHVQIVHEGQKHKCDPCNKIYLNATSLKIHIEAFHE